ncbi:MAG: bifunctional nuclease family protein [candidate division WOR-3 bacterium]
MELVEFIVDRVQFPEGTESGSVVYLKEKDGNRELPIVIGLSEAQSIMMALQGVKAPRPLTHDLLVDILNALNLHLKRVVINDLRENTYYARIVLWDEEDNTLYSIDARPSDSIAIALRVKAPIFISTFVLKKALYFEGNV